MQAFFSRFSLKIQIGVIVAMATLVSVIVGGVYVWSAQRQSAASRQADEAVVIRSGLNNTLVFMQEASIHEKDFLLHHAAEDAAEAIKAAKNAEAKFDPLIPLMDEGELRQRADRAKSAIAAYGAALAELVDAQKRAGQAGNDGAQAVQQVEKKLSDEYAKLDPEFEAMRKAATAKAASIQSEAKAIATLADHTIGWSLIIGTLSVAGLGFGIARAIYRPIDAMVAVMGQLAEGRLTVEVPSRERRDEVGRMARAVHVFKQNAIRVDEMSRAEEERAKAAEEERARALQAMAEKVETETRRAVEQVVAQTANMASNADGMAVSASAVADNSQGVAAASAQAEANAEAVAAATEELSSSIEEIAGQINASARMTRQAVEAAGQSRTIIGKLSEAVDEISKIASLINDIASQTNLLALNATIEAARAGEAGKGFAVVANEVKHLATQTAKATDEINAQIANIQNTTGSAVQSVTEIADVIHKVEDMSSAVAVAVEQQTAATGEIARNVAQTSQAANEVAKRIAMVSSEAAATGERADSVSALSGSVKDGVEELMSTLVRLVRTATPEVNRRAHPRYETNEPIEVISARGRFEGRTVDISVGGIRAAGLPLQLSGERCRVILNGQEIAATVLDHHDEVARFRIDPAAQPIMERWIESRADRLRKIA